MVLKLDKDALIKQWKEIIILEKGIWVLFENGTIIKFLEEIDNIEDEAKNIMEKWGPVVAGTNLGDFSVFHIEDNPGWIVSYSYEDMHNYVSPEELKEATDSDSYNEMIVGLIGREKRKLDAQTQNIIHVEKIG